MDLGWGENMKYNIPDRVLRDIASFAHKHQIETVILFGSRATGTYTERSDIDIAASGGDFDGFYWDIKENVHSPSFKIGSFTNSMFDMVTSLFGRVTSLFSLAWGHRPGFVQGVTCN